MSTRSRTRSESNSMKVSADQAVNPRPKQGRPRKVDASSDQDQTGKENKKVVGTKVQRKGPTRPARTKAAAKKVYCLCKQPDDGSAMVNCAECKDWYHFRCIDLNEKDADDISIYICPTCTTATGRRTIKDWEGPEAMEECSDAEPTPHEATPPISEPADEELPDAKADSESYGGTEDEYVAEPDTPKGKGVATKRRTRRLSLSSDSETESNNDGESISSHQASSSVKRNAVASGNSLKRKPQRMQQSQPSKRQKPTASSASDDPTRTFCLKKLQELFCRIFLKYPHVLSDSTTESLQEKKFEDLTDTETNGVEERAKAFATDVEQCVYDIYSEPDGKGKPSAGGKYKERFRMLTFNLGKDDRVVVHKRIASSNISPKELSLMSSTDLADEETKQSIKIAEQEALEHSILQKTKAPRAKITHKGMVDIEEDANSEEARVRERELERELEEEERRERERTARLKAAQSQQRRASSVARSQGSIPPESPITPHQAVGWGGPPPLPIHAMQTSDTTSPLSPSIGSVVSSVNPMFSHNNPDFDSFPEPQLDLAELINIDDEPSSHGATITEAPTNLPAGSPPAERSAQSEPVTASSPATTPVSATGISPFAASVPKSDILPRPSFDLNALWTAPKPDVPAATTITAPPSEEGNKANFVDPDILGQDADDQDFDMFLEKDQDEQSSATPIDTSPEAQQVTFDSLPKVWSGKISMPLDSTLPQETPVIARQVGGRQLGGDSMLWRTLFPSQLLRVDGRVAVDQSAKYLLQMRMNSTKELIAVALSPNTPSDATGFSALSSYLIGKNRHGLIFPWGMKPKPQDPGRELYIIPLHAAEPLPDYLELLDDLRLPKARTSDLLVGIWILNKGKLVAPPIAPIISPALPIPAPQPPIQPLPVAQVIPPSTTPLQISPDVLAAEMATLTPEQIQLMLRTLSATNALPPAAQQNHNFPPNSLPAGPPQPWPNAVATYPVGYSSPHTQQPPPHPSYHQAPYRHDHAHGNYNRGGRGWSGENQGRGRGRGRGYDDRHKPSDSSWAASRNRGNWDGPPKRGREGGWS